jgi:predicted protein tyrosine phosphatase
MWHAFRQKTNSKYDDVLDVKAVNCLDWCERQKTNSKYDEVLDVKAVNILDWCEVCLISQSIHCVKLVEFFNTYLSPYIAAMQDMSLHFHGLRFKVQAT